jgi:hypothetical protein
MLGRLCAARFGRSGDVPQAVGSIINGEGAGLNKEDEQTSKRLS